MTVSSQLPCKSGKGSANAFQHIMKHFNKDEDAIVQACVATTEKQNNAGGDLTTHMAVDRASTKERAMFDWIDLIVSDNVPISKISNPRYRRFSRHNDDDVFGAQTVHETLLQLKVLMGIKIADEMKHAGVRAIRCA